MEKPNLLPYFNKGQQLKDQFILIEFHHVPRHEFVKAEALAGLAASMSLLENDKMEVTVVEQKHYLHLTLIKLYWTLFPSSKELNFL